MDNRKSESDKLIFAAKTGDVLGVVDALRAGADKQAVDPGVRNYTALHWSAQKGQWKVVVKLLNVGIDTEARDDYGQSALHHCCFYGQKDIVYC